MLAEVGHVHSVGAAVAGIVADGGAFAEWWTWEAGDKC
jgi:hypothetical protein